MIGQMQNRLTLAYSLQMLAPIVAPVLNTLNQLLHNILCTLIVVAG
jgi:hypothetical protein